MTALGIEWGKAGVCPSCGVVTEHTWFWNVLGQTQDRATGNAVSVNLLGQQGVLKVSRCVSTACESLAVWFAAREDSPLGAGVHLVYPSPSSRVPPEEGLTDKELDIYEEAAAVEHASPRAACALVRVLLEAVLKRMLEEDGFGVNGKNLWELIDLGVENLGLSRPLKTGLTAIRMRGNSAVHDPYGLTDETRADELEWLFTAVDDLIDDVHYKRSRWANMSDEASS